MKMKHGLRLVTLVFHHPQIQHASIYNVHKHEENRNENYFLLFSIVGGLGKTIFAITIPANFDHRARQIVRDAAFGVSFVVKIK